MKEFFLVIIFLLSGSITQAQIDASNTGQNQGSHRNKIDDAKTDKDIRSILSKADPQWLEVLDTDTADVRDTDRRHIADSLGVKPLVKADFDHNGYTDMMVMGHNSINGNRVKVVMDEGGDKFSIRELSKDFDTEIFPVFQYIDQRPCIIVYRTGSFDWFKAQTENILRADTLIYRFGDFIELNRHPAAHHIEKLEYETSPCFGTCPVFNIKINKRRMATYTPIMYDDSHHSSQARIDSASYTELVNLLNYIDFEKLDSDYRVQVTDQPGCTLTIRYDDGKVKRIHDYPMQGTKGLMRVYDMFFRFRKNEDWE